ncbi:hypothetical protein [Flavobacterium sp. MK4S-17]|uniref:hypothetical protein n=1 Tax=Flavobacterium sp. MK4S-17 TaxID=2543737 RepID=UPI00135885F2|nr:hypothetical protein [Flavobacterium sp. MK4S-17]
MTYCRHLHIVNKIIAYEDEINELNKKIGSIINNIKDSLNNEVLLTIQKHDKIGKNIYESLPVKYEIQHYNSLLEDIALKQEAAKNLKKELQQIKNTESYLVQYTEDLEKLQRIFSNFRKTYRSLNKITQYNNFIFDVTNDPQINTIDKFNKHSKLKCDSIFNEIGALRKDVSDFKTLYYDFTLQYEKLKNNYKLNSVLKEAGTEKFYEYADGLKTRAENMNRNFDGNQLQKDLNAIYVAIKSMYDEDTYNWVSAPFVPTGDVVIFEVDLKKKEPTTKKIFNERKFVHREFTYGGTRIDFGLGLAASYFDNTPVYELSVEDSGVPAGGADSGNTSVIRIKRKSNELIVPSLVGMATMSYRSSHYITFGASAGLGIDVVNGKIQLSNFFAGPSVIFGRYERLVLTAGASFRNVGRLKSGYKENSIVSGNGSDIDSFISDRYKLGVFMALTFNLTKGIKQNIKSVKSML